MPMLVYIIVSLLAAGGVLISRNDRVMKAVAWIFYISQAGIAIWMASVNFPHTALQFFTIDNIGIFLFALMSLISPVVFYCGLTYLDVELIRQKRLYNSLLILLCMSVACVYFSNNIAVTWIFLEATTLCTAGLIYHRRVQRSLEATWKYIFVCSVGIAIAYLGILLIGAMSNDGDLSYSGLSKVIHDANPLFVKLAFLFILTGYSCKLEIFPLYTIGVDANFAAPTPASALISTSLVNAGFLAIYRVYEIMSVSPVFPWISRVLIIAGIISILIGAVFMRRANHYKRFLSYSTVENMGIVAVCLGLGGVGVYAAILHIAGHSLLKSAMFLQIARVGKTYGNYQIGHTGDYINVDKGGSVLLILTSVFLLAFPPSPLFISEVLMFKQMILEGRWVLLLITVLLLCMVLYNFGLNIINLCFKSRNKSLYPQKNNKLLVLMVMMIVGTAVFFGAYQPEWLKEFFMAMTHLN